MRKYVYIILLFTIFIYFTNQRVNAKSEEVKNLLEIQSISYLNRAYKININKPINLNKLHTFYFDTKIFGVDLLYLRGDDFGIFVKYSSPTLKKYDFINDETGQYVEFTPYDNIESIFVKTTNAFIASYEPLFMFYEGDKTDFPGFIGYADYYADIEHARNTIYLAQQGVLEEVGDIVARLNITTEYPNLEVVVSNDTYTDNYELEGVYNVDIKVVDNKNNIYKNISVEIRVMNVFFPYIIGPDEITIYRTKSTVLGDALSYFQVSSNMPPNTKLYIESNEWDVTKVGTYQAQVYAFDFDNNKITKDITINLVDNSTPIIEKLADVVFTYDDIEPVSKDIIISNFNITDDALYEDLIIIFTNYDNYLSNSTTLGNHVINFTVSDDSGNEASSFITIRVLKRKTVIINPDNRFFLNIEQFNLMTIEDIKDWFANQLTQEGVEFSDIEVLFTNYVLNSPTGQYYMDLLYVSNDQQIRERVLINITDVNNKKLSSTAITLIIISVTILFSIPTYLIYIKKIKTKKLK